MYDIVDQLKCVNHSVKSDGLAEGAVKTKIKGVRLFWNLLFLRITQCKPKSKTVPLTGYRFFVYAEFGDSVNPL